MKRMVRFSAVLAVAVFVLALMGGSRALGQVSSFPYSYNWTGAAPLTPTSGGDGNWETDGSGSAPRWGILSIGGVSNSPCAVVAGFTAKGKQSNLDLLLDLSGMTLSGVETYEFQVKVSVLPASGIGSVKVQADTSGKMDFIDLGFPVDMSALSTSFSPISVLLPQSMGNKSGVRLRIAVMSLDNSNSTPQVFVDDNIISGGSLPIQLASSAANVIRDNNVEVSWTTVSETNNFGFEVYRKRGETGDWTMVGFVQGHGTTLTSQSYSYIDESVSFGKYLYRIRQVDLDGQSKEYPEMEVTVGTGPDKFVLAQNYPNPFNPSTMIEFVVPKSGFATMKVYNVLGQEVATLFEGNADAGKVYSARFDASNIPSGMYFYTLKSAEKNETKRMILMK